MDKNDLIFQVTPILTHILHRCIGHQEKPLVVSLLSEF